MCMRTSCVTDDEDYNMNYIKGTRLIFKLLKGNRRMVKM